MNRYFLSLDIRLKSFKGKYTMDKLSKWCQYFQWKKQVSHKHLENRTNEKMRVGKSFFQVHYCFFRNPLSPNFTKWSNTLKQFVGKLWTNCLSVFDHFVGLALKGSRVLEYKPLSLSSIKKGFYYAKMFESQSASE